MSHVCAKPACTEVVHVWLDFVPVSQQVIERSERSEVSVGLCAVHAARFTVPDGWSFERAVDRAIDHDGPTATEVVAVDPEPAPAPHRKNSRERPWFLALRDDEPAPTIPDSGSSDPYESSPRAEEPIAEPTVGSLLYRAFHGPDRGVDTERAVRDQLDELESRRAARETGDYTAAELPFPPVESEHRVAVS